MTLTEKGKAQPRLVAAKTKLEKKRKEYEAAKQELVEEIGKDSADRVQDKLSYILLRILKEERRELRRLHQTTDGFNVVAVTGSTGFRRKTAREKTDIYVRMEKKRAPEEIRRRFADAYNELFTAQCKLTLATKRSPIPND